MVTSQGRKAFDAMRTDISEDELKELKFFRENWSQEEIRQKGLAKEGVVTSFDRLSGFCDFFVVAITTLLWLYG